MESAVLALERKVTGGGCRGRREGLTRTGHVHATSPGTTEAPHRAHVLPAPSSQEPPGRASVRCLQRHGPRVEE